MFVLLLLLNCFIFILVLLLCCLSRSLLYYNIPSDVCTLYLSCYYFYIVLSLYLYCCCCCVSRSLLYCNIPSDLCTLCLSCYYFNIVLSSDLCSLCLSCYYFYIVLSLFLYCCYVKYLDHHFTVIYLKNCVLCVCLVITSTLFYLYMCTVVM